MQIKNVSREYVVNYFLEMISKGNQLNHSQRSMLIDLLNNKDRV